MLLLLLPNQAHTQQLHTPPNSCIHHTTTTYTTQQLHTPHNNYIHHPTDAYTTQQLHTPPNRCILYTIAAYTTQQHYCIHHTTAAAYLTRELHTPQSSGYIRCSAGPHLSCTRKSQCRHTSKTFPQYLLSPLAHSPATVRHCNQAQPQLTGTRHSSYSTKVIIV